ncbi:cobyrinic acid a,c-diamide synthase [Desulfonatronum thiosulfatophilum]|uniref:Cobyrinate a,c-diamide synthase n=1 Tax=Desulfonatronum thiosulfatophilum TaxID=617002 RepID=A0A1G6AW21_9BACT|nr:cobyrinate a,c-diamide synthase [Desulfonatronum thiosulfatophilum]SDB12443.1 cobyrinic acid a,c-diamide synthase [Desulfonatronum thiosulfatophilum]
MKRTHTDNQIASGVVIAGTRSGCGKTLATLGLATVLRERGLCVQGYKVGPDFIDPSHLSAICDRPAHNLDGWMLSRERVLEIFHRYAVEVDFCLVEGVMGLYDGASGAEETGSTAQMAKWLGLPVLLVVDARSQGRSAAALVQGFRDFDPELHLAGVIFTQVGGPRHEAMLREAMASHLPELPCLGCLPRRSDLELASRHLGLHMAEDLGWDASRRRFLADWVEQGLDMELLHRISRQSAAILKSVPSLDTDNEQGGRVRLGVARDRAFCFYYQENLRLLENAGAELVFFSPLTDGALPDNVQGLFFGGGYPELHAAELTQNHAMRAAVAAAAEAGMPVYAECGGMQYLLAELEDVGGAVFPMVGLFPARSKMHSRFQALGYRKVELRFAGLLGPAGTVLRGHEFHYSALDVPQADEVSAVYRITDSRGREFLEGFQRTNVLASYIHLHFGSHPPAAASFVRACANWAATASQGS